MTTGNWQRKKQDTKPGKYGKPYQSVGVTSTHTALGGQAGRFLTCQENPGQALGAPWAPLTSASRPGWLARRGAPLRPSPIAIKRNRRQQERSKRPWGKACQAKAVNQGEGKRERGRAKQLRIMQFVVKFLRVATPVYALQIPLRGE